MKWSELDGAEWAIPEDRAKGKKGRTLWLPQLALDLLPAPREGYDAVFGRFDQGFSGWSRCKRRLDAKLADIAPWVVHDIRRSVSTHLNELGESPDMVESLLGHSNRVIDALMGTGGPRGIEAIYNRARYSGAAKAVLERWAGAVSAALVTPEEV
jgi:integrase